LVTVRYNLILRSLDKVTNNPLIYINLGIQNGNQSDYCDFYSVVIALGMILLEKLTIIRCPL
jgi:hypothetical protein